MARETWTLVQGNGRQLNDSKMVKSKVNYNDFDIVRILPKLP